MEIVTGLAVGLVFFVATIKAYSIGLSHGKLLSGGYVPKVAVNPIRAVKDHQQAVETKKEADKLMQGIENLFSYVGDKQKEE